MAIINLLQKPDSLADLRSVREVIVDNLLVAVAFGAVSPVFSALYRCADIGWNNIIYFHLLVYLLIGIATVFRRKILFDYKAMILIISGFLVGATTTVTMGLMGNGSIYLLFSIILATMFYGVRHGVVIITASLVLLITVTFGINQGWIVFNFNIETAALAKSAWIVKIFTFTFFTVILISSLGSLINHLVTSGNKLNEQSLELKLTNEKLSVEITEKEKAEQELTKSERKYRNLFENLYDVYYRTDDKGIITLISPSVEKYFGYRPDEIVGRNMQDSYIDMKRREEFLSLIRKDGYVDNFEARLRRKDNSVIWVATNAKLIRDEKGNFAGVEGITRDITERKTLESKLVQAQKMESIGTLAGGIAHDFNNILFPIIAHSELIMYDLPSDSRLQQNISEILKAAERAKNLVRQILTFSRKKDQEVTPVQVGLVVKEAMKLLRASIPATIEINTTIKTESDTVLADPTQIHQILMNLCTNAAHAMGEKGGVLEVDLSGETLEFSVIRGGHRLKPGGYVKIRVSDTGQGISPENMERIFDPYFTTKDIEKGTGLGLSVVHGIVTNYGGKIAVESELGKGTVFSIWLPAVKSRKPDLLKQEKELPRGTEKILVVDDEKEIVDSLGLMLKKLGYEVTTRTSSIEALEAFRSNPGKYDLVITDMTMPNMTGKDLVKALLDINPEIPVVLCTGFSLQVDESIADEIGISAYIMKPVIMGDIATTIREVLDKKRQPDI